MRRIGEHAIVVGASVAGLLAARALSEAYEGVTLLERDRLPAVGEGRRAVPQGRHAHLLLPSGQRAMEELLPGLAGELVAAGARWCASLREIRFVVAGHELPREAPGADCLLASRPLIEGHLRRRVLGLPNVTVAERREAGELLASPDRRRVEGLRIAARDGGGADEALRADLVVFAGGRGAQLPAWLERLGYAPPAEERLDVDLMYASRRVRLGPGALGTDRVVLIGARPGLPRGLAVIQQEDHWIVTASGYGRAHRPPTDEEAYLEFVATVAPPDVLAALRAGEPLTPIVTHAFPANRRRRYDRLRRFPAGLLVIGDAITSFNPLYGQGMSVAALEALALRRCLEAGGRRLARRYMRAVRGIVGQAWGMSVGGDLGLPEVPGHRSAGVRLTNAYVERLLRVAERDPLVAGAFNAACDLLEPPSHVMSPRVAWRVLRHGGSRPSRGEAGEVPETAGAS